MSLFQPSCFSLLLSGIDDYLLQQIVNLAVLLLSYSKQYHCYNSRNDG